MTTNLTYAAEAASSKTLEALAQVIRALAPEVSAVSFHDFAADTLWLSEDFLLPEDHQLVEDSLTNTKVGDMEATYAAREDGHYSVSIPVRDSSGAINGAVRLSIDSGIVDTRTSEPLEQQTDTGVHLPGRGIRTAPGIPPNAERGYSSGEADRARPARGAF